MTMNRGLPLLFVLVAATSASAQAPAPAPSKPDVSALEASGSKHYALAEYDAAIADFKEAFRISDEPGFLFNIAQAYRMKNECRDSATFYKNYLRRATEAANGVEPANAAKVRGFIADMDACAAKQPAPPPTTAPPTTPPTTTATTTTAQAHPEHAVDEPETPPPAVNDRAWMKWTGLAGIGVGLIGGGLAVKFALDGKSANDDLTTKCATSCTSAEALAIQSDGKAANRNAVIFSIGGGALLVGGVALLVLSRGGSQPASEPSASLQLTHGGATASYGWRF